MAKSKRENGTPGQVEFHYIKANDFRVVHSDGAYGGVAPRGDAIHIGFYSERIPFAKSTTHKVEDGIVGEEITNLRKGKTGIVREMEVDVVMSIDKAQALYEWLKEKLIVVGADIEGKGK